MKEEMDMDPIVIVTGCERKEDTPLGNHLKSHAEEMGGRFVAWRELLEEKGVDQVKVEGKDFVELKVIVK